MAVSSPRGEGVHGGTGQVVDKRHGAEHSRPPQAGSPRRCGTLKGALRTGTNPRVPRSLFHPHSAPFKYVPHRGIAAGIPFPCACGGGNGLA